MNGSMILVATYTHTTRCLLTLQRISEAVGGWSWVGIDQDCQGFHCLGPWYSEIWIASDGMIPEIMHSNVLCLTIESQPECPDFRRQFHVTIKQRLAVHAEGKIVTRPFFGRLVHQKFRRKPATTKKKFRRKISRWGCGETTWEGRRATKPRVMGRG